MNNLAEVLRLEGDLDSARGVGEQAVEASRRVFGAEHPTTLMAMNNLALALHAKGDAAAARDLHEQELAVCRRVRGEEHPETREGTLPAGGRPVPAGAGRAAPIHARTGAGAGKNAKRTRRRTPDRRCRSAHDMKCHGPAGISGGIPLDRAGHAARSAPAPAQLAGASPYQTILRPLVRQAGGPFGRRLLITPNGPGVTACLSQEPTGRRRDRRPRPRRPVSLRSWSGCQVS